MTDRERALYNLGKQHGQEDAEAGARRIATFISYNAWYSTGYGKGLEA